MMAGATTETRALKALIDVLLVAFTTDELLQFVRAWPGGAALLEGLPAEPVSRSELFTRVILALDRTGGLNPPLFARFASERPLYAIKIREVGAALYSGPPSVHSPAPTRSDRALRTMEPEQALQELLAFLFSVDELRRWLRFGPDGEALVRALPSDPASLDELTFRATELLLRRDLIDSAFFDRLCQRFPHRKTVINEVRTHWTET